jgi:hypothetical protein
MLDVRHRVMFLVFTDATRRVILQACGLIVILGLGIFECRATIGWLSGNKAEWALLLSVYLGIGCATTWLAVRPEVNYWQSILIMTFPYIIASAALQFNVVISTFSDGRDQLVIMFIGFAYVCLSLAISFFRAMLIDEA